MIFSLRLVFFQNFLGKKSKFMENDMFHVVAENMNASVNELMYYIKVISHDPKEVEMLTHHFKERVRQDKKGEARNKIFS